ncbi:54S ribosomal protein L23, mitochondrial [Puttea exsequens]|nr:54S ribosomal protein L23, mitochondrial [Puttea exsequens]
MSQTLGKTRLAYARAWHHISLSSPSTPPLGRLASQIAIILMGKHKPIWDPSTDCGDYVVATGCTDVYATGKKMQQKLYYKQTTRPGALKSLNMESIVKKWGGGEVLKRAVNGMLPKNRLRKPRLERLKVFEGEMHPYKQNFIKFDGQTQGEEVEVQSEILKQNSI